MSKWTAIGISGLWLGAGIMAFSIPKESMDTFLICLCVATVFVGGGDFMKAFFGDD